MTDIEKYIIENRDSLDSDEPGKGHVRKFKRKMRSGSNNVTRKVNFRHALQIAASIAIILASGVVIVRSSKGSGKMAANPEVEEFQETRTYYARQVNQRYEDINSFHVAGEQEKEMLLDELSEMDTYYKELLDEMNANPGDERVISALIQHYQLKLEIMDQIIEQLKQIQNTKNIENEKANV